MKRTTSQISNGVNQFNILIVGTGGQGQITLLQILAEAALIEGYDVKTSELHGLSQRGGSVEVHIRFGKKIFSPLIPQGQADLIIGLEMQECLKACYFANPKTNFLINKYIVPIPLEKTLGEENKSSSSATELSRSGSEGGKGRSVPFDFAAARVSEEEILNNLKKISKNIFLIPATEICQEKLGTNVVAGVYLISLSSFKNLIPMKPSSLFKAIKKIIPEKYLELNLKTFNLASDSEALK